MGPGKDTHGTPLPDREGRGWPTTSSTRGLPTNDHKTETRLESNVRYNNRCIRQLESFKIDEDMGTIQKLLRMPLIEWRITPKLKGQHSTVTPENVRLREEAAARCTKMIKRKVLKKQARKARAEHLVKCCLEPRKKKVKRKTVDRISCERELYRDVIL